MLVFIITLAGNYVAADFLGNFGGPDNLPHPGFRKVFIEGTIKFSPLYLASILGIIISAFSMANKKKD